jgi:ligand-binding sensor domain-containing protein
MMLLKAIFILFCLHPIIASGQMAKNLFTHYSRKDGYIAKEALSITQDKKGLVWIGSNDGLTRFDSKSFKFFYHDTEDTTTITSNYCKSIVIDKKDKIWIISDQDLDVFDTKVEQVQHVKLYDKVKRALSVRPKQLLYDSINDRMWIATRQGLYYSQNGKLPLVSVSDITDDSILIRKNIASISLSYPIMWLTNGVNLLKLNVNTGKVERFIIPLIIDGINNGGDAGNILCSYLDKQNNLWMGTWVKGLIKYNITKNTFNQYTYSNEKTEANTIPKIVQTNIKGQENLLWLACYKDGLCTFDMATKKFASFSETFRESPNGIKGDGYTLYYNNDILWIGGISGLANLDFKKQVFSSISLEPIAKNQKLLPVSDIVVERNTKVDSILWLYIPYYNAYRYDIINNRILPIPSVLKPYINGHEHFLGWHIDKHNNLWISTTEYGLIGYDLTKKKIIVKPNQYFNTEWAWVTTYYETKDENLFIGTYKGLYKIDLKTNLVTEVEEVNRFIKNNDLATAIISITQDELDNLWFTVDNSDKKNAGIVKYNVKTKMLQLKYDEASTSKSLNPHVQLRSIIADQEGKVYAVFFNEHIQWCNSADTSSNDWTILQNKESIINTYIDYAVKDKYNRIWISNVFGVSSIKSKGPIFTDYMFENYGLGEANNPFLYISPNSGYLYIGRSNAISIMDPQIINQHLLPKQVIINYLKVNGNIVARQLKSDTLFKFKPKQNSIELDFAILSFTNAEQNKYAWQLVGFEDNWHIGYDNKVSYNNLLSGNYVLKLKACGSDGVWTTEQQIFITIATPFYKTWWFILISIFSIALVVYYFMQLRIRRLKEKFALRNKIASDLHDEIGSTLTSISILSDVSQKAMDREPHQAKEMLAQISTQSKSIQQNMSDIVWSIRPDNDSIEDLIVRMREYATYTLEPKSIETKIIIDDTISIKAMNISFRKDLLLIYKEAINNIAKHANATSASVSFVKEHKILLMSIKDNGTWKGITSGTGTKTMKERAKTLGGNLDVNITESGTEVVLKIHIP